jgi:hypothetical protein
MMEVDPADEGAIAGWDIDYWKNVIGEALAWHIPVRFSYGSAVIRGTITMSQPSPYALIVHQMNSNRQPGEPILLATLGGPRPYIPK